MTIIKTKKTHNYTIIANSVIMDRRISLEARGILIYLLSRPEDWETRLSDLQNIGVCGKQRVQRIVKELIAAGYVRREKVRDASGQFTWDVTVSDTPIETPTDLEIDDDGNDDGEVDEVTRDENQAMVSMPWSPCPGKPPLLKTDTKDLKTNAAKATPLQAKSTPTPKKQAKPKPEPKPKTPPNPDTTKLLYAYQSTVGYKIDFAREGKDAKWLVDNGYSVEDAIGCYKYLKTQLFWSDKPCGLSQIKRQIGEWIKAGRPEREVKNNGRGSYNRPSYSRSTEPDEKYDPVAEWTKP